MAKLTGAGGGGVQTACEQKEKKEI